MFVTKKHISRRTMLHGIGVTVALPFLESMLPAMTPARATEAGKPKVRLACLEMVHGSAGSTKYGIEKNMWAPAQDGDRVPHQAVRDAAPAAAGMDGDGIEFGFVSGQAGDRVPGDDPAQRRDEKQVAAVQVAVHQRLRPGIRTERCVFDPHD